MTTKGQRIKGSSIACHYALRTVTRPDGRAVRLSGCEMAIFHDMAIWHPKALSLHALEPGRRYVFVHRLRAKLAVVGVQVLRTDAGYLLKL